MKKRTLTEEEKRLWALVKKTARPLRHETDDHSTPPSEKPSRPLSSALQPSVKTPVSKNPPSPLIRGSYAGIDRKTADRFRKGDYTIDATLDLHGLSRDKAHRILQGFIQAHYSYGHRCLLVITGKGRGEAPGILREMLPRWLDGADLRAMVLAFDVARPQHGGAGAFYVLLKRARHH